MLSGRRSGPSSYYDWREIHGAGATLAELDKAYLVNEIMAIHDTLDDTYGSPRLTSELRRERSVNHKRVERVVREHGLYAKDARRKKCRTTIPDVSAPPLPDDINRDFRVGRRGCAPAGTSPTSPQAKGGSISPAYWTSVHDAALVITWWSGCRPGGQRTHDGSRRARWERQGNGLSR